jgi:excisionase family DNA binding protein
MNKENFPLILKAKHVAEIMGCSERTAYEMMELNGFPLVRIGRLKRVNRDAFLNWFDQQSKIS